MAGGGAALGEILLVIFLGAVKRPGGFQFGDDGAIENAGFFERGDGCARFGFLFGIVIKNCGAVLRADVRSLTIERGGIVILKKCGDEFAIGNLRGIEFDFDGFGVAGRAGADVFISGIFFCAAGVADGGGSDAFDLAEGFFDSPEASGSESGFHYYSHCVALVFQSCHNQRASSRSEVASDEQTTTRDHQLCLLGDEVDFVDGGN